MVDNYLGKNVCVCKQGYTRDTNTGKVRKVISATMIDQIKNGFFTMKFICIGSVLMLTNVQIEIDRHVV